jgi:uncharacterized membrane protein HdeD (DUF308 family)
MAAGMQQGPVAAGLNSLRRNWGWYLALGIVEIILGAIAIAASQITTVAMVLIFGWLLVIGGVLAVIHAFWRSQWSGFFVDLVIGLLYALAGLTMVFEPVRAGVALTLLIAIFLVVVGIFRIAVGLAGQFAHRGWLLLNGIITLILGVLIWSQWPLSGLWVIGLFVGIEMIFYGWSLVMLSVMVKNLPRSEDAPSA